MMYDNFLEAYENYIKKDYLKDNEVINYDLLNQSITNILELIPLLDYNTIEAFLETEINRDFFAIPFYQRLVLSPHRFFLADSFIIICANPVTLVKICGALITPTTRKITNPDDIKLDDKGQTKLF